MKHINIKKCIGTALLTLFLAGCSNILDEQPRATFTPEYFKTEAGVMGGLTYMYYHLRYIYGNLYFTSSTESGTDESTWGSSGSSGSSFQYDDFVASGVHPTASLSNASVIWGYAFTNINTANGILQYGGSIGIDSSLLCEARFFRAFDYFLLVQTFGGVPLDLGSGRLKLNTSTVRTSVRDSVSTVYTKAIFPDLQAAIRNLPDAGRVTGGVTKTVARLYLAKAYLTYAWWLENPNNIPTYPIDEARSDPDGHTAQWYYQQAYNLATYAISSPAGFGLQSSFYNVNVATNDRNNEILLYADHTQNSALYNGGSLTYSGDADDNVASWAQTWNYTSTTSGTDTTYTTNLSSVQREAAQWGGRPWVRIAPTIEVFTKTFADKTNDSRYDGTFASVYRGNWAKGGNTATYLYNANKMKVANGDAILTFLPDDSQAANIDYTGYANYSSKLTNGYGSIGAGVLPGRADWVISPSGFSRIVYPGIWKLGPYRTDNGTGLGSPNAGSTRPYNIAKFSEFYFIAAEAAVKLGDNTSAYNLINVIRARAGKWSYSNANNATFVADNSAAMVAATPATITIDYILAERSREYYGEGYRWYDLVRTQRWEALSSTYTICGTAYKDHTPVQYTRYMAPAYYLRPIPQGQLDAMEMTLAEKKAYQNPAYQDQVTSK
jgi:starch-binding outer membrane protein, SusD/RagB family